MINTFLEILDKNKISYTEENNGSWTDYTFILNDYKVVLRGGNTYYRSIRNIELSLRFLDKDNKYLFELGLKEYKDYNTLKNFYTSILENKSLVDILRYQGKNLHFLKNHIVLDLSTDEMTLSKETFINVGSDTWKWNWNYLGLGTRSIVEQFENVIDKNTGLNNTTNFTNYTIGDYDLSVIFTTAYGKGTPYDYKYNELKFNKFSYQGVDYLNNTEFTVRDSVCGLYYPPKERLLSLFLIENMKNYTWFLNRSDNSHFSLHDMKITGATEVKAKLNWR